MASASEIDSGRVVVAGNWYADDAIEVFDGDRTFSFVKKPSVDRTCPYILRTAMPTAISQSTASSSMPSPRRPSTTNPL
ncbi:MAG: hypothetical protein J6Y97_07110 [Prevotella sp.]|nr:hypothetical protein [Prevotella sp.]